MSDAGEEATLHTTGWKKQSEWHARRKASEQRRKGGKKDATREERAAAGGVRSPHARLHLLVSSSRHRTFTHIRSQWRRRSIPPPQTGGERTATAQRGTHSRHHKSTNEGRRKARMHADALVASPAPSPPSMAACSQFIRVWACAHSSVVSSSVLIFFVCSKKVERHRGVGMRGQCRPPP